VLKLSFVFNSGHIATQSHSDEKSRLPGGMPNQMTMANMQEGSLRNVLPSRRCVLSFMFCCFIKEHFANALFFGKYLEKNFTAKKEHFEFDSRNQPLKP